MPINLGTIQKENEEKEKQALEQQKAKQLTSYVNVGGLKLAKSRYEYKAEYEQQKTKKSSAKQDLDNYYSSNGVVTSNNVGVFPTATPTSYQNDLKQFENNKYTSIPLNPVQALIERQKASQENYEKYLAFEKANANEIQEKKTEVANQYNKTAEKYNDYQQRKLDSDNIGWYDKSLGRIVDGGPASFFSRFGTELSFNETGDLDYQDSYNELKHQKVLNSFSDSFWGKLGKITASALYETGRIATTAAINAVAPNVGTAIYFTDLYTKQYDQTVAEGYNSSQALTYATLGTLSEVVTGKMLGGTTKAIFGGSSSELSQLISSGLSKFIQNNPHLVNAISNAISEGSEEFVQEYLDVFNRTIALGENFEITSETFENAIYSAAVGALSGGVTGAFDGNIYQKVTKQNVNVDTNVNQNADVETNEKESSNVELPIINSQAQVQTQTNTEVQLPINYQSNIDVQTNLENSINLPLNENVVEEVNNKENVNVSESQVVDEKTTPWRVENNLSEISNNTSYNIDNNISSVDTNSASNITNPVTNIQTNNTSLNKDNNLTIDTNPNNYEPIKSGAMASDISSTGQIQTDVYDHPEYYFNMNEKTYQESMQVLNEIRNNPNAEVTIYSVTQGEDIKVGDKVTLSETYAKDYLNETLNGNGQILSKQVKASDILYAGDNINEFGYYPTNSNVSTSNNVQKEILRDSARKYLNNTTDSKSIMNLLEKIIDDKGYIIKFNPNITNEQGVSVDGKISKENGQITIELNPNSRNYVEFLLVHEITHDIATDEMKKLILDYAEQNPEFERSLETLKERYKTDDVSDEVVADVCAQLFGNREFIQSVAEKKPNIFKKILNNIKELAKKIKGTGADEYVSFVENLKTMWEDAYYSKESKMDENKTFYSKKVENQYEIDYNKVSYEVIPYISADERKIKFLKYSQAESFYELDYETMNRAIAIGSKYAIEAQNKGLSNSYFTDNNYMYYFDVLDTSNNAFGITKVFELENVGKEVINEIYSNENRNYIERDAVYEQKSNVGNNNTIKNGTTSNRNVELARGKQEQQGINEGRQDITKSIGTLSKELDSSSFSLEEMLEKYVYSHVYEYCKNEDKTKITENLENLKLQREELDPDNRDNWDKKWELNTKINALEQGYDTIYDYIVAREKKRLKAEVEYGSGVGYDYLKEGIKKEKKEIQLKKDIENSTPFKNAQFKIIQETNPAPDDNYVWIRSPKDIKTFEETINDGESFVWGDYSKEDALRDLKRGKVRVYSSYAIKNGTFVSTSYQQALDYAGGDGSKVHSREVALNSVAWINGDEGQYAKVYNLAPMSKDTKYSIPTKEWLDHLEENYPSAGTKTKMSDIKLPIRSDVNKTSNKVYIPTREDIKLLPSKEVYKSEIDRKVKDRLRNKSFKMVTETSKKANDYINFDRLEKQQFKSDLEKYRNMTKEELQTGKVYEELKEIVGRYANREVTYVNEELKETKNFIRNRKIKVTDYIKNKMDYNSFRKENFGKLNLTNEGITVSDLWEELTSSYPQYFSRDVINDVEMLEELSSFMNQPTNLLESYQLTDSEIRDTVNRIYDTMINNSFSEEELKKIQTDLEDKYSARTRLMVQQELLDEMGIELSDIASGEDISHLEYLRTDPIRLNEKVFGHKIGKKINDATINKTKDNEASRIRFLNKERKEISDLGIKARSKESAAVQKYAEKSYVTKDGHKYYYGDVELARDFSDVQTQEKIKNAVKVIRGKYDTYIDSINQIITSLGYDEIPKRKDYMRHFQELSNKFSEWGLPLSDLNNDTLPTDINGITDQFRPGKNWFASAMERKGEKTAYDAITGIDGYLEGASNLIYHTKDIQRYRTLSKLIRNTYGQTHGLDDIKNLSAKDFNQRLSDIQNNKLSKYVAWLDEQANSLAGKKGLIDRAGERVFGRKVYGVLNWAKKQVGSNMTGFNVRSALTNFASTVQGASKTNKMAFIKGIISTNNNLIHKDNMIDKSTFLTSRFGSDTLSKNLWQKMSNAGQVLMSGTDYYTSNVIWRSKYIENIQKGMSETQAIKNADDFSARIMGDRSKGATAEIFNSKTLGVITQFQLEVNNQWSSLIHDNKMELNSKSSTASAITFQLGQLFAMSYLFNGLFRALTGSDVMIDPIQMLLDIFDDDDEDKDLEERVEDALAGLVDDLPFASLFTSGGRLPISEAFTGLGTTIKKVTNQTDTYGNDITWGDVGNDIIESAFYWLLPTGYGQLKKTYKGAKMYDKSLPIAGSYTDSGNLRFEADTSVAGKAKALLFGQYSSSEAQKYIDSGYKTIDKDDLDKLKDLDMSTSDYREYRTELNSIKSNEDLTTEEKKTNIASKIIKLDLSDKEKGFLYSKYYSTEDTIEEMLDLKIPISEFIKFDSQSFQGEYDKETGKTISGSKKKELINYVNSLNLSVEQKAILIKSEYNSYDKYDTKIIKYVNKLSKSIIDKQMLLKSIGFDNYDRDIVNYINSQNISKEEKEEKLKELGFAIRDGRVYY